MTPVRRVLATAGPARATGAPGTGLEVVLPRQRVLLAGLVGYGLPLAGLLSGAWLPRVLWPPSGDAGAVLGGMTGLLLAGLALRAAGRHLRQEFTPRLIRSPAPEGVEP